MYTVEDPFNIIMEDYRIDNFYANPPILHIKRKCFAFKEKKLGPNPRRCT